MGKYTHIQSINGNLLDGLNISEVTSTIQSSLNVSSIQLMVRYVHPVHSKTVGADVMKTSISPKLLPEKCQETLPIPLMILGDIHVRCKELFNYLSGSGQLENSNEEESQVSTRSGSNAEEGTTLVTCFNVPFCSSSASSTPKSGSSGYESRESSPDLVTSRDRTAAGGRARDPPLFQSDKYVQRLSVSHSLAPLTMPIRIASQIHIHYIHYILNMFTHEIDRKFVHLYLRQSGVYLVVVSLEDLVEDPVIQFENLLFWLRLVQTYVGPNGIKRVMVVGMSDGHMDGEREKECRTNLEGALREAEFQHMYVRGVISVMPFDRSRPKMSLEYLCKCIRKCMEDMISRAWHMDWNFYNNVFWPFNGLTKVLQSLSYSQEMLMPADSILSLYKYTCSNFFDTLAAYSPGLIDARCKCVCACD